MFGIENSLGVNARELIEVRTGSNPGEIYQGPAAEIQVMNAASV